MGYVLRVLRTEVGGEGQFQGDEGRGKGLEHRWKRVGLFQGVWNEMDLGVLVIGEWGRGLRQVQGGHWGPFRSIV
jgi:hypothetical protein